MLAMGRALMGAPKLLMLDEPSLGLAPIIVADIFRIVGELRAAGVSVLLVEQNAQAALQIADRAYVMELGEFVLERIGQAKSPPTSASPRAISASSTKARARFSSRRRYVLNHDRLVRTCALGRTIQYSRGHCA